MSCGWGVDSFKLQTLKKFQMYNCDQHQISPYDIAAWSSIQVMRIKEMITKLRWNSLLFKQVLPTSYMRNVWRQVRRICLLTLFLGFKGLNLKYMVTHTRCVDLQIFPVDYEFLGWSGFVYFCHPAEPPQCVDWCNQSSKWVHSPTPLLFPRSDQGCCLLKRLPLFHW